MENGFKKTIVFLDNDLSLLRALQRWMIVLLGDREDSVERVFVETVNDAYRAIRDRQERLGQKARFLVVCDGNLDGETGEDLLDSLRDELDRQLSLFIFFSDDERYRRFADGKKILFVHKNKPQELDPLILAFLA